MRYQSLFRLKSTIIFALFLSCCDYSHTSEVGPNIAATPGGSALPANKSGYRDPSLLCSRISEIKVLPIKGERGEDPTYDAFMNAGDAVVPCLIRRVTDETKIRDPRQEPGFPDIEIRVADVAYFLLVDITRLSFAELLPDEVRRKFKAEGVYAYFEFVKEPANRKRLQDKLERWYQKNNGRS
jgi:hypothetical protein